MVRLTRLRGVEMPGEVVPLTSIDLVMVFWSTKVEKIYHLWCYFHGIRHVFVCINAYPIIIFSFCANLGGWSLNFFGEGVEVPKM